MHKVLETNLARELNYIIFHKEKKRHEIRIVRKNYKNDITCKCRVELFRVLIKLAIKFSVIHCLLVFFYCSVMISFCCLKKNEINFRIKKNDKKKQVNLIF